MTTHNDFTLAYNMEVPVFSFTDNQNRVLYISIQQLEMYNRGAATIQVYTSELPYSYASDGITIKRNLLNKETLHRFRSLEKEYKQAKRVQAEVNSVSQGTSQFIVFCRCGGVMPSFNVNIENKSNNYSYCPYCEKEEYNFFLNKIKRKLNILPTEDLDKKEVQDLFL